MTLILTLIEPVELPIGVEREISLKSGKLLIGRTHDKGEADALWTLPDERPKPRVHREHCLVECIGGKFYLVDQKSKKRDRKNGVVLNYRRLAEDILEELHEGDCFMLCDAPAEYVIRVTFAGPVESKLVESVPPKPILLDSNEQDFPPAAQPILAAPITLQRTPSFLKRKLGNPDPDQTEPIIQAVELRPTVSTPNGGGLGWGRDKSVASHPSPPPPSILPQSGGGVNSTALDAKHDHLLNRLVAGLLLLLDDRNQMKEAYHIPRKTSPSWNILKDCINSSQGAQAKSKVLAFLRENDLAEVDEALDEVFHSLKTHQAGMLKAMEALQDDILGKLEPGRIEKVGKKSLMPGSKTAAWNAFKEAHAQLNPESLKGIVAKAYANAEDEITQAWILPRPPKNLE